jgi:hypothetical protein
MSCMSVLAGRALVLHAGSFADPEVATCHRRPLCAARRLAERCREGRTSSATASPSPNDTVFMSARADAALTADPTRQILMHAGFSVRSVDLSEIEKAGGSLRCCVAEVF